MPSRKLLESGSLANVWRQKATGPVMRSKQVGPVRFLRQLLVAACGRVSSDRPGFVRVRSARRDEQSSLGGGLEGPTH